MISPSDWVLIGCTITLAVIALTAPYLNELWKRKSLAPKLKTLFHKESPYILEVDRFPYLYSLCFKVKNEGNSKAKNCEVIIENFCYKNEMGNFIEDNINFPSNLKWVYNNNSQIDILPKAGHFFYFLNICDYNDSNYKDKLFFEIGVDSLVPSFKEEISLPLNYLKIKIVIYSENAKKCEQYIEIKSPGIKRDNKEQVLKEMQITFISKKEETSNIDASN